MSRPLSVVIVGGGAGGTLAAIRLAAHPSDASRRITIVEPAQELGLGAAYGTRSSVHLLNVRASGMSAFPEAPGHFLAWARADGIDAAAADFLPRLHYGGYLRASLREAVDGRGPVDVVHLRARAVLVQAATDGHLVVELDDERRIGADHVVLATGNAPSPFPGATDRSTVVTDPWTAGAVERLRHTGEVLIVGTGLTAVDVVLTLHDIGHAGRIRMISSHGLLPESHAAGPLPPAPPFVTAGTVAARSIRTLLAAARAAAETTDDWRRVIDGFRSETVAVWRDLPDDERRRFLRHLGRRWEVRRHRMAPEVADVVNELRVRGVLVVERGRVRRLIASHDRIRASLVSAGVERDIDVDGVVVCTGPGIDPQRDPLLSGLIEAGLATRHPLGIGLSVDHAGRLRRPDGMCHPQMWAMGSLRRGAEGESTAVPELRIHARDIASSILGSEIDRSC